MIPGINVHLARQQFLYFSACANRNNTHEMNGHGALHSPRRRRRRRKKMRRKIIENRNVPLNACARVKHRWFDSGKLNERARARICASEQFMIMSASILGRANTHTIARHMDEFSTKYTKLVYETCLQTHWLCWTAAITAKRERNALACKQKLQVFSMHALCRECEWKSNGSEGESHAETSINLS